MKKQNIELKLGSDILRGRLFIPNGKSPFPGVISFHGSGGKGEKYFEWAEKLAKEGIMAFAFNFRGCGISSGDFKKQTLKNALEDGKTAFDFFLKQNINKDRVGLIGGSFGGFVASMLIPKLKINSLVLISPSAHMGSLSNKIYMGGLIDEVNYFKNKNNWLKSKSYLNISKFTESVLIIKSEYDENVPAEVVEKYYEQSFNAQIRQIKTISGADHRLSEDWMREEVYEVISDWFLKTL